MDFHELISKIAIILDGLHIRYAVTGGYAVSIWGRLRATFDIDVIIELEKSEASALTDALREISRMSFIDKDLLLEAIERKDEFQFIDVESGIKIDFWVLKDDLFSREKMNRRIARSIEGKMVYFLSPEDLILSKLLWSKESESEQQLGDVASIIRIQRGKLDWKYLKKWAKEHSTLTILEQLLKDHGGTVSPTK